MLVFLGLRYVSRAPFGLAMQGLRDEPARMRALGFDVTRHRTLAFTLAAFVAGIAGVLSVCYNPSVSPGSINLEQTINILIIAVVGGLYRLEGAWVGALAYALLDNYSRDGRRPSATSSGPSASTRYRDCLPADRAALARWPGRLVGGRPCAAPPRTGRGGRGPTGCPGSSKSVN